ncbi:adenine deaminase [Kushneria pakistanensis]|uniref:Adenine deaminase n=1 Tax=Kushneria pakistanensis TaxID=1508770 RepID=A0ABQ3FLT5_9GAMM|nr:adenosine deaminase [Kushneria pakistanensis]GHC29608.1 adenine deaminase [Kushneria pakistanensis]
MKDWLQTLPKAELHLHIEGTLEPELMFELAARNDVALPYASIEEVRAAYNFTNLQSFLDLYYQGMNVLYTEQDFYDLAMAYFERAHQDGVVHIELSFDPQPHLSRGVAMRTLFAGLGQAREEAERRFGMSTALIMSFLRDRSTEEAMDVLEQAAPWYEQIDAVGLDSAELGNPPEKFAAVFERARTLGIARLAHAGEEGPAAYISGALDVLDVCRIDHGVRCVEDEALVARLANEQIPLTVCPLSNVYLKVFERLEDHTLPAMLDHGLCVTLNSDDPAYFGGGMLNNFVACHEAFGWDEDAFRSLARNAIEAAFMSESRREQLLAQVAAC